MQGVKPSTVSPGILNLSKIPRSFPTIITVNLYTRTERNSEKSHYETLDIPSTATISEVKSAYYKLSMLYHPDKNTTEHAKERFRAISEAYEILGNYDSRTQYDRMLVAKKRKYRSTGRTSGVGQKIHQTQQSYAPPKYPKGMKIYDFNEWTNQHYRQTFRDTLRKKMEQEAKEDMFSHEKESSISPVQRVITAAVAAVLILLTAIIISKHHQEEAKTGLKRRDNELDK